MTIHVSFITETTYYPADLMQGWKDIMTNGVISFADLIVSQLEIPSMTVQVTGAIQGFVGGNCWVDGYRIYNDSNTILTIDTADITNPRIDIVVIGIDITTVPYYTPVLQVIKGTASSSPIVPTIPGTIIGITLAEVYVDANVTSIINSNITDKRVIARLKINNMYSTIQTYLRLSQSLPASTNTKVNVDSDGVDNDYYSCPASSYRITIKQNGWYLITASVTLNDVGLSNIQIIKNSGISYSYLFNESESSNNRNLHISQIVYLNENDYIELFANSSEIRNTMPGNNFTRLVITKVGE